MKMSNNYKYRNNQNKACRAKISLIYLEKISNSRSKLHLLKLKKNK